MKLAFINSFTESFRDSIHTLWFSRKPRERTLVTLAAVVLLCGGLYAGVLDPALRTTQRLKIDLPVAQAKLAQVQSLATAAKQNLSVSQPGTLSTQAQLQASLNTANINATVSTTAPWVVTVNATAGESLWLWLKTHSASQMSLKRNANGSWSGELTVES